MTPEVRNFAEKEERNKQWREEMEELVSNLFLYEKQIFFLFSYKFYEITCTFFLFLIINHKIVDIYVLFQQWVAIIIGNYGFI